MKYNMRDTIFALSTVFGKSGVALFRISGPRALEITSLLGCPIILEPRRATVVKLWALDRSDVIDECVVIYFQAPHSFNGEHIIEIHTHGSVAVINDLLEELGKISFLRLAEPGEFTKIAFYNGKMDLTKAEALADLIDAETSIQRQVAMRQLSGELENLYNKWRKQIIAIVAQVEALIDFPEEDIPQNMVTLVEEEVINIVTSIENHLTYAKRNGAIMSGISVVIAGPPNVGKSSIINAIAQREIAIVSHVAGTTRDVVQAKINLQGFAVMLSDTAGIRETDNLIEQKGILRAKSAIENADILIVVLDATEKSIKYRSYLKLLMKTQPYTPIIFVLNKCDAISDVEAQSKLDLVKKNIMANQLYDALEPWHYLVISARTGEYIESLLAVLSNIIKDKYEYAVTEPHITRLRQQNRLVDCISYLKEFNFKKPMEMAAQDLICASNCIGAITGHIHTEEVLDVIFQTFCIGK